MKTLTPRNAALRDQLLERRHTLQLDVADRLRSSRAARDREVGDDLDFSDADVQHGMDFTLLQMKSEMLSSIEHALHRVETGTYGVCVECDDDITERRLRAIPFAKRCQSCEGQHEGEVRRNVSVTSARFEPDAKGSSSW